APPPGRRPILARQEERGGSGERSRRPHASGARAGADKSPARTCVKQRGGDKGLNQTRSEKFPRGDGCSGQAARMRERTAKAWFLMPGKGLEPLRLQRRHLILSQARMTSFATPAAQG